MFFFEFLFLYFFFYPILISICSSYRGCHATALYMLIFISILCGMPSICCAFLAKWHRNFPFSVHAWVDDTYTKFIFCFVFFKEFNTAYHTSNNNQYLRIHYIVVMFICIWNCSSCCSFTFNFWFLYRFSVEIITNDNIIVAHCKQSKQILFVISLLS